MKRLFVFILLVLLLCCVKLNCTQNITLDKIFPYAKVEIFTESKSNINCEKIDNGLGEILFCEAEDIDYILKRLNNVVGLTIKIYGHNKEYVLQTLNVKKLYNQNFGNFGWSKTLEHVKNWQSKSVVFEDGKVNFQCLEKDDYILVGTPIILGSY